MIIVYILSTMWGIGCIGGACWMAWLSFNEGYIGIAASVVLIGFPLAALLAYAPWGIIADARGPDLVTLKKADWVCTESHVQVTMMLVGKIMMPQSRTICDQYGRS